MEETGCHIHFPDSNRSNTAEKSNQVGELGMWSMLAVMKVSNCIYNLYSGSRRETRWDFRQCTSQK